MHGDFTTTPRLRRGTFVTSEAHALFRRPGVAVYIRVPACMCRHEEFWNAALGL